MLFIITKDNITKGTSAQKNKGVLIAYVGI